MLLPRPISLRPNHGRSFLPLEPVLPILLRRLPRLLDFGPQRVPLASLLDRPLLELWADFLCFAAAERVQAGVDEEGEEVVDRDVRWGGEEDLLRDAEVGFEEVDDGDDRLGFAGSGRLESARKSVLDERVRRRDSRLGSGSASPPAPSRPPESDSCSARAPDLPASALADPADAAESTSE